MLRASRSDSPDHRFSGAACFTMLHHVPTAARQDRLFAEVARVLEPGGALVASDSLASEDLAAGFADVEVRTNEFGWAAIARV